jgi:hypothetical protein
MYNKNSMEDHAFVVATSGSSPHQIDMGIVTSFLTSLLVFLISVWQVFLLYVFGRMGGIGLEPLPTKKMWSSLLILSIFCRPCMITIMVSMEEMWKSRKIERKTEPLADNSTEVVAEKKTL